MVITRPRDGYDAMAVAGQLRGRNGVVAQIARQIATVFLENAKQPTRSVNGFTFLTETENRVS